MKRKRENCVPVGQRGLEFGGGPPEGAVVVEGRSHHQGCFISAEGHKEEILQLLSLPSSDLLLALPWLKSEVKVTREAILRNLPPVAQSREESVPSEHRTVAGKA